MRSESDGIAGTRAYLPEEYKECGLLTKSVDTFAFGILIFELITGQRPCNELRPKWLRGEHMQMDSRSNQFFYRKVSLKSHVNF